LAHVPPFLLILRNRLWLEDGKMDQDFIDRVNAEWAAASPGDVDVMKEPTKRLSTELADNYVGETPEATTWMRRRSGEAH
jgi:hypothetical protein